MNQTWNRTALVLAVVLAIGGLTLMSQLPAVSGQGRVAAAPAVGPAHYTVVETEGHNLLVTDNATNTLYFYTVDKGEPVGSELKLRGSVDLTSVGKPSIKPTTVAK